MSNERPLPRGQEKVLAVQTMFDDIAPKYDFVNRLLTLRMDVGWRREAISSLGLIPGSRIVDIACGTGDFCHELKQRGFDPVGVDYALNMLRYAPQPFPRIQGDALRLPFRDEEFDGLTCGFALRNFENLPDFFAEACRVTRPGGRIALLDVATPTNRVLRFGHQFYFNKVVPLVGGLMSNKEAYAYLPKSVEYFPPLDEMISSLDAAGFVDIKHCLLSGGISQLLSATRTSN